MGTVLLVDDSQIIRDKLRIIIENENHEVCGEAENGNIAFEKYQELKPDLVMLDVEMPECNGLEALKKIKEFDSNAKVIMCSSLDKKKDMLPALKLGAMNFIVKPFSEQRVIKLINNVLK